MILRMADMNHCQIDLGQVCRGNDREWTLGSGEPKEGAFGEVELLFKAGSRR